MLSAVGDSLKVILYWVYECIFWLVHDVTSSSPYLTVRSVYNSLGLSDILGTFSQDYYTVNSSGFTYLLPLFAVGIAISVILLGVKIIRSFVWGSK